MGNYIFTDNYGIKSQEPIRLAEYAYDFDRANFKRDKEGSTYLVYDKEALKIKIWKLFMTERYRYLVFDWDYGHELLTLIGKSYTPGYINSEAERFIKEAIFKNLGTYVKRLDDINIFFEEGTLYCDFTVVSIYGETEIRGLRIFI